MTADNRQRLVRLRHTCFLVIAGRILAAKPSMSRGEVPILFTFDSTYAPMNELIFPAPIFNVQQQVYISGAAAVTADGSVVLSYCPQDMVASNQQTWIWFSCIWIIGA